jgi:hypothetical protein
MVPPEIVHAISKAFQRSPAAIALEFDFFTAMKNLFLFDEFIHALTCHGSSTPGESGLTYRLLQLAPQAVEEEIFEHARCTGVLAGIYDP